VTSLQRLKSTVMHHPRDVVSPPAVPGGAGGAAPRSIRWRDLCTPLQYGPKLNYIRRESENDAHSNQVYNGSVRTSWFTNKILLKVKPCLERT
jgi:hypothetical protein